MLCSPGSLHHACCILLPQGERATFASYTFQIPSPPFLCLKLKLLTYQAGEGGLGERTHLMATHFPSIVKHMTPSALLFDISAANRR